MDGDIDLRKQLELAEYIAKMNDLIDQGVIRNSFDFLHWLEGVKKDCVSCFDEIEVIVKTYVKHL